MNIYFFLMKIRRSILLPLTALLMACNGIPKSKDAQKHDSKITDISDDVLSFPSELVDFRAIPENPIFMGSGGDTWDEKIRERGYILKEGDTYHMWYTGLRPKTESIFLGYATSKDGLNWARHPDNPIFSESWTEDMMVLKVDGIYHMFAEGKDDVAHRLTSMDGVNWTDHGSLDIRNIDGSPLSEGPYGTPTVWKENAIWFLFYERNDQGVWLATSKDLRVWTNIQDDPVIAKGPENYDQYGLAVNQIVKYNGTYYAYYHGTAFEDWREWSTNVAASHDLIHWEKYGQNPILGENRSSGILVPDGNRFRLYTMHGRVDLHFPAD